MNRTVRGWAPLCALSLLISYSHSAFAQNPASPNYLAAGLVLDGGGGGSCSENAAAWTSIGFLSDQGIGSVSFAIELGFLPHSDPQPSNAPVLFGVTPDYGPKAGGTPITISGLNFDKFGSGATVAVKIGGAFASSVVVQSNTQITALTPSGISGFRTVEVSSVYGATNDPSGFLFTPAITTTPIVPLGAVLDIKNYGPVGNGYMTFVSTSVCSISAPPYGTLLIGPSPFVNLIPLVPYPGPDGIDDIPVVVPDLAILHGLVVHFQSLSITNLSPILGTLTNASSTAIP